MSYLRRYKMDLKSRKHSFGQNAFHFVWKCKYARDPMKFYGVRMDCEFFIRKVAYREGCKIYELHVAAVLAAMEDAGVRIDTYRMGEITARLASAFCLLQ